MGKKTITTNLSQSGIKNMIRELEKYKAELTYKTQLFVEKLAECGVEIARVKIADYDAIFTGELIESIHKDYVSAQKYGAVFAVVASSSHAVFVELGTGQMGLDTPYPYTLPQGISWDYVSGKTVRQNPVTGRYYWFYPGKDGVWHYTEGLPSRPFMYETSMELTREVVKIAKEVFK